MPQKMHGVYFFNRKICTRNTTPGYKVYGEKTIRKKGKEYRIWDPYRSKVAAAIAKGLEELPINNGSSVLYLGASTGTTASHIADIAHTVYCVEFSKRMMRNLLHVCQKKKNMVPVLADARHPWEYTYKIGPADVAVQDVAQPDQAQILLSNQQVFGFEYALLSIKARSIDSSKDPKKVFKKEVDKIRQRFEVLQKINLAPYEEDHIMLSLKVK